MWRPVFRDTDLLGSPFSSKFNSGIAIWVTDYPAKACKEPLDPKYTFRDSSLYHMGPILHPSPCQTNCIESNLPVVPNSFHVAAVEIPCHHKYRNRGYWTRWPCDRVDLTETSCRFESSELCSKHRQCRRFALGEYGTFRQD